ncbi:hypothetical protein VNI00_018505 [Paramarasmius palmivorus]|uniref:Uncharacterized protein n=1 Tax=Paramarasmius palmivorus TaxID=297713 RepID=A0AAW0AYV3_9AGAR
MARSKPKKVAKRPRPTITALNYDVMLEVLKWSVKRRREERESFMDLLVIRSDLTQGLLPQLYNKISATTSRKIRLLLRTLKSKSGLLKMINEVYITCGESPDLRYDENGAEISSNIADTITIIAPTVTHLHLRLETLPDVVHVLRTVAFPELRVLRASYMSLLNIDTTIRLHPLLKQIFREEHKKRPKRARRITLATEVNNWPKLKRMIATFCPDEMLEHRGLLDFSHIRTVEEFGISVWITANPLRYIERVIPPPKTKLIAILRRKLRAGEYAGHTVDQRAVVPVGGVDGKPYWGQDEEDLTALNYVQPWESGEDFYWDRLHAYLNNRDNKTPMFHVPAGEVAKSFN